MTRPAANPNENPYIDNPPITMAMSIAGGTPSRISPGSLVGRRLRPQECRVARWRTPQRINNDWVALK